MVNYTDKEKLEIANTIIRQMGGAGKIKAMTGAKTFLALDYGVQFDFKGCKKANKVRIELNEMDTYNVSFFKIPRLNANTCNSKQMDAYFKKIEECKTPVETIEGVYDDMLKSIFEETTGLYLSF